MDIRQTTRARLQRLEKQASPSRQRVQRILWGALALAALGAAGLLWDPYLLALGILFVMLSLALGQQSSHLHHARAALDHGRVVNGIVTITVIESTETDSWTCEVRGSLARWSIPFTPEQWTPRKGSSTAILVYIEEVDWPAIIVTTEGIIVPESRPARLE